MRARLRVEVRGAVQGVGFRPFAYALAHELGVSGWVENDPAGVVLEIEAAPEVLHRFLEELRRGAPAPASVEGIRTTHLPPRGDQGFRIRASRSAGAPTAQVLPDLATCPDCLREVLDPGDRRHAYPFTNCTRCGPRFSILRSLPYDRARTTMAGFRMCKACHAEYVDPADRRFHAQPNACPRCGPRLRFWGADAGRGCTGRDALSAAAGALCAGAVVAVKGLCGFHLMTDATRGDGVARLRRRKQREAKPLAVMVASLEEAEDLVVLDEAARALLASPQAPIVLLPRRPGARLAEAVAPGNPNLGLMLAYTPLHHLLLRAVRRPVVATSGNLSDEPICTDEAEAKTRLAGLADAFLVHDRPIERPVDDSVAWAVEGRTRLLRRARGYAPSPIPVRGEAPPILAVGGHLKNTVAVRAGGHVFVSQHVGDLDAPEAIRAFERAVADLLALYAVEPVVVAHDLHPDYASTRWAESFAAARRGTGTPVELVAVQHHHAHLVACLTEHRFEDEALGITWDGTGYGPDGTVWGGELLLGDARGYRRLGHLLPFRLPGGEAAVREPRRSAIGLLAAAFGERAMAWEHLAPVRSFRPAERGVLATMVARGVSAPETTSAGRLFDAIAALVGGWERSRFEGEAAMRLEHLADAAVTDAYPLPWRPPPPCRSPQSGAEPAPGVLDWRPLLEAVLADLRAGVPRSTIAARFHNGLAEGCVRAAGAIGTQTVVLAGGCFQNRLLLEHTARRLRAAGHGVLVPERIPPNDGGLSVGQAVVAAARAASGGHETARATPERTDAMPTRGRS